ncbi:MAG TPA: hypothetical protein VGD80_18330 [Kofleriaceae bacterium]
MPDRWAPGVGRRARAQRAYAGTCRASRAAPTSVDSAARGPKGRVEALCNAVYDLLDKRER